MTPRQYLGLSFGIILLLAVWARIKCWTCDYISHTLPHIPYPTVVLGTLVAMLLFWSGTQNMCTPKHPPSFHLGLVLVTATLGLTLLVTIRMARRTHWALAMIGYAGLLGLLWWDAVIMDRSQIPLVALAVVLVLQLLCFAAGMHGPGAVAQLGVTIGLWGYILCLL